LKAYATLIRRGFPPTLVRESLSELRKDAGGILDGYQFDPGDGESEDG
jgi:hypothetical protein